MSARHQRKEKWSHRASGHRSGGECDADKNLGKNGLHEGRSNSNESPTGRRQSRSDLRSRKNTNNVLHMGERDLWMSFPVVENLEMLRRRSQPDESTRRMNLAVASKFIDGVKNDEFRTMLATHYTTLSTNAPTPEEVRLKSKEYLLLKPPSRSGYYKNNYGNSNNGPANQGNNWYKPRDDMDRRRSCANCSSTDHHVAAYPTYKQGIKAIGFSLEDEGASEVDHEDFMS